MIDHQFDNVADHSNDRGTITESPTGKRRSWTIEVETIFHII